MRRVIADTSVFIDFLRGRPAARFEAAVRDNAVLLSPLVRLELLQGVRRDELRVLTDVLGGLPQVPHQPELFATGEMMVRRVKGSGLNVGVVDLLLAAQARLLRASVMSGDAVFARLDAMGLVRAVRHH